MAHPQFVQNVIYEAVVGIFRWLFHIGNALLLDKGDGLLATMIEWLYTYYSSYILSNFHFFQLLILSDFIIIFIGMPMLVTATMTYWVNTYWQLFDKFDPRSFTPSHFIKFPTTITGLFMTISVPISNYMFRHSEARLFRCCNRTPRWMFCP